MMAPCVYCWELPATTVDHVWPRAKGGDDHPNNLLPACLECNSRKNAKSIFDDWCYGCGERSITPGDVDTATQTAYYACRCGHVWSRTYDFADRAHHAYYEGNL